VSKGPWFRLVFFCVLLVCAAFAVAEDDQNQKLDRQFQSAVAQYDAGRFAEAASQLEKLLPYASQSFEVHELLDWSTPRNRRMRKLWNISKSQSD